MNVGFLVNLGKFLLKEPLSLPSADSEILMEDGTPILMEDGTSILLEESGESEGA